ncbi:MAG: BrnT family toxin [Methyloligellaceae bacterium]
MRFTWDEKKRLINLKSHDIDFVDAPGVFAGPTFTFEDDRFNYEERRFVTLGFLSDIPVSIVHTESATRIHIISFRKATRHEEILLVESIKD